MLLLGRELEASLLPPVKMIATAVACTIMFASFSTARVPIVVANDGCFNDTPIVFRPSLYMGPGTRFHIDSALEVASQFRTVCIAERYFTSRYNLSTCDETIDPFASSIQSQLDGVWRGSVDVFATA